MGDNKTIYKAITPDSTVADIEDVKIKETNSTAKVLSLRELDVTLGSLYRQRDVVDAKISAHLKRLNEDIAALEQQRALIAQEAGTVKLINQEVT